MHPVPGHWDEELLSSLDIPRSVLPDVFPKVADFGQVTPVLLGPDGASMRIGGLAGDQQSSLLGQACLQLGDVKNTYFAGCLMLMHTGHLAHTNAHGLFTTCAAQTQFGSTPVYALEGGVFMGGAMVQWLRNGPKTRRTQRQVGG